MSMTLEQAKEKLAKDGQEHVLKYYGELSGGFWIRSRLQI